MSSLISEKIERILRERGIEHEITEHEPVFTSEEAARVRGVDPGTGVKALVLRTPERKFLIGLCPGDRRLDLDKIARIDGVKRVSLATPEEVLKVTDCEVGSVPPFGHPRPLPTFMDREVLENEWVNFNIGEHTKSARMRSKDLEEIANTVLI